jgi:putative transcriptional regulator
MNPRHHPQDEFLLRYASGELTEPLALVVASHLAFCPECRGAVTQAEAMGGALLETMLPETAAAPDLQQQIDLTLARANRSRTDADGTPMARTSGLAVPEFPLPLRAYAGDAIAWRPLGPGIQHRVVAKDRRGTVARLLKIAPGRSVFEHGHSGIEMTLVLQGSYLSAGMQFTRGDVESADEATNHQPVADPGATCICLAVTDAPLRFRNLLGRIMQPFIGI